MAHNLNVPAIKIDQPGLKSGQAIYLTSFSIRELIDGTMFKVDFWKKDMIGKPTQGYQRFLNDNHAQKISSFLAKEDAVLPTSVLVSTRDKTPVYKNGQISIEDFPLYIVDGQHRIAGFRLAVDGGSDDWAEAKVPVVILSGFPKFDEIVQFVELNTKQKKVETDLALQLMYDMSSQSSEWRNRYISEGSDWKVRAIKIVNELNKRPGSPWQDSVKIAGEKKKTGTTVTSSNSLATSLKPLVRGVFEYNRDIDTNVEILSNYWGALRSILPDAFLEPRDYAIQKTPGLFSLHTLLQAILSKKSYDFGLDKNKLTVLLKKVLDEAEADVEFWRSDNTAGVTMYGSMKGFRLLADKFIEALGRVDK